MKPNLYTRLLGYVWPHRGRVALQLMVTSFIAALELLNPWPLKIIIDSVFGNHPLPGGFSFLWDDKKLLLISVVALGFLLKVLVGGLRVLTGYLHIGTRQRVLLALKSDVFQHLQRQSFAFHDNRRLGDSIHRVNSDAHCIDEIVCSVQPLIMSTLTLGGMLCVVLKMDWLLALVALAVAPFLYQSVRFYAKRFKPRISQIQRMEAESTSIVQETLSNLRVVKAFTREEAHQERFVQQGLSTLRERIRLTVQQQSFSVTTGLITAAGTAVVLGLGASHVLDGSLTMGSLLVVLAYLGSIYGPLESISNTLTYIHSYLAKAERVFEILDSQPDVRDEPGAAPITLKGRVTFENVSLQYRTGVNALHGVDLAVRPGEVVGVVGPTGAGKTTLVSLIPRFYDVTAGRVLIDGLDVRRIQLKSLREQIGLVFQESILFSGTVRENIGYGRPGSSIEQIVEAAKAANAHEFIMQMPEKYETQVGERGVKLSGGERQRVSIARAFLKDAPILILDEPTSSVDSKTESAILEALDRLMVDRTTFIVAHRLSTLRRAGQIVVLDQGKIVETGKQEQLITANGLYQRLHELQFGSVYSVEDRRVSGVR